MTTCKLLENRFTDKDRAFSSCKMEGKEKINQDNKSNNNRKERMLI